MTHIVRSAALLLALIGLAGCAGEPSSSAYPPIRFIEGPPLRLDVAKIDVVQAYRAPLKAPNVEHLFPIQPADAAGQWARDRLRAAGSSGRAEAVVQNAAVIETALKRTTGIRGAFTTDQTERYDATITVVVRIFDDAGNERASANATARRSRTVAEDITVNERERQWYQMTVVMMRTVDESLQRQINKSLSVFLK